MKAPNPESSSPPTWLVPIIYLQMITISLFVVHEVFWDAGGIAPTPSLQAFLPQADEQPIVLGMVPPTPAPKESFAQQRWLNHPRIHHRDIEQTTFPPVSCNANGTLLDEPEDIPQKIPFFVIAGTQKAGTSALYYLLKEHAHVVSSTRFETHFFDNAVRKLPSRLLAEDATNETICQLYQDYRKEFPENIPEDAVTFEKVPAYLCRTRVPAFLKRVAPWTKIIFILRNPIDRAHSSWKMEYNTPVKQIKGFRYFVDDEVLALRDLKLTLAPTWSEVVAGNLTSRNFQARPLVLKRTGMQKYTNNSATIRIRDARIRNLHCGHLSRGMYAQQLIPWLEAFGREQMLFLQYEKFQANQTQVLQEILDFVGVDKPLEIEDKVLNHKFKPRNQVQRRTGGVGGDMREYLRRFYKPYNDELANLLGEEWRNIWD